MNDALVVYSSCSHLVLCFFRNVLVTDALCLCGLAGFICILHFWPGRYPGLCGLQHHHLFLAMALYVHRACRSCGAVYCVAVPWLLMSTFYPKTLMHLELSLSSCKSCCFVPKEENDLSLLQRSPDPKYVGLAWIPYLNSEYSVLHFSSFRLSLWSG